MKTITTNLVVNRIKIDFSVFVLKNHVVLCVANVFSYKIEIKTVVYK